VSSLVFLIPAKSGSQRLKNKNLKKIGKSSLLEIKIKSCLHPKLGRVIVSTNSLSIANYSKKLGAEVPFIRPSKYSSSKSSTISAVLHALRYLLYKEKKLPEFLGILPCTNPFLKKESIRRAFVLLKKNKNFNSVVSYTRSVDHPFIFVDVKKKNQVKFNLIKYKNLFYSDLERTQDWPETFISSSALKITRVSYFKKFLKNKNPQFKLKTFDLNKSIGYKITQLESLDINTNDDLNLARALNIKEKIFK